MTTALIVSAMGSMISSFATPNIQSLQALGVEVHVAANFSHQPHSTDRPHEAIEALQRRDVTVHDIHFTRSPATKANVRAGQQLRKLHKLYAFSMIHSMSPTGSLVSRLSMASPLKRSPKQLYFAHGFHFYRGSSLRSWLAYYPIELAMSALTDYLVTTNQEDYQRTKNMWARSSRYVPGVGVDTTLFTPAPPSQRAHLREELGLPNDAEVILTVGELNDNKNQAAIVDAMSQILADHPRAVLLIVGTGERYGMLSTRIDQLGIGSSVHLLGYRTDVPELLKASDVVVSASLREGLPVNVIEAMATGVPVVGTDIRGTRDLIKDDRTGILVQPQSSNALAYAIDRLLSQPETRFRMSHESLSAVTPYSVTAIRAHLDTLYSEALQ